MDSPGTPTWPTRNNFCPKTSYTYRKIFQTKKNKFYIHLKELTHWHTHLARPPKNYQMKNVFTLA